MQSQVFTKSLESFEILLSIKIWIVRKRTVNREFNVNSANFDKLEKCWFWV